MSDVIAQKNVEKLELEARYLQQVKRDLKKTITSMKQEEHRLEQSISSLRQSTLDRSKKTDSLKHKTKSIAEEIAMYERKKTKLIKLIEDLEKECHKLKSKSDIQRKQIGQELDIISAQKQSLAAKQRDAEQKIHDYSRFKVEAKEIQKELDLEKRRISGQYQSLNQAHAQNKEDREAARQQVLKIAQDRAQVGRQMKDVVTREALISKRENEFDREKQKFYDEQAEREAGLSADEESVKKRESACAADRKSLDQAKQLLELDQLRFKKLVRDKDLEKEIEELRKG